MKKFLLPVVTMLTFGSMLFAVPTYANGFKHKTTLTPLQRQANLETRLNALVASGKITANQKTLIENKLKEMAGQMASDKAKWKSLTPTARKALRLKEKTDLQNWEKANGISPTYLFGMAGKMNKGRK